MSANSTVQTVEMTTKPALKMPDDTFTVLRNGQVSTSWVLELELVEGAHLTIDTEGRDKPLRDAIWINGLEPHTE